MVTCVRTQRENAEETRRELSKMEVLSSEYEITAKDGYVYIPVTEDVEGFKTVDFDVERRESNKSVEEVLGYKPTYEWIGDIVVLKEESDLEDIVSAFELSSMNPRAILNKETEVKGDERVPEYEVLYGSSTETVYKEYGYEYEMDVVSVYFTPRLSTERKRFMDKINSSDTTFDMFAGVGPYTIPSADIGLEAVGVDINPEAVNYLRRNAERNNVANDIDCINDDVRNVCSSYEDWADNVVMNLPHTASEYLEQAEVVAGDGCRVFLYDFVSDSLSDDEVEDEIHDSLSDSSRAENFIIRNVRPYAPGVSNVCIEFDLFN